MKKPSFLLASVLALAALALPGAAAAANQSHTESHHDIGTLTVQVERKGLHTLGWSALDFKLAACQQVAETGCTYSLAAIELPSNTRDCPATLAKNRLHEVHRVYLGFSQGKSLQSGAHSFDSFSIEGGTATLCWYVPVADSSGNQRIVASTTVSVSG